MTDKFRFEVLSWDFARVPDLYHCIHENIHGADWGIKGHNRSWIVRHGSWQPGMRFLDVGAGYSDLPAYLVEAFDAEGWVADDFGMGNRDKIWSRWGDPTSLPEKYPRVKYVFHKLGDPVEALPLASFDRIYSVSVLEHIPPARIEAVLTHMAQLLKPGGLMLHAIDLPFPRTVERSGFVGLAAMLLRVALRQSLIAVRAPRHRPFTKSVEGWAALLHKVFKVQGSLRKISTMQMILDKDVLVEPPEVVYRFYPPNDTPKNYWRAASLTMILKNIPAG